MCVIACDRSDVGILPSDRTSTKACAAQTRLQTDCLLPLPWIHFSSAGHRVSTTNTIKQILTLSEPLSLFSGVPPSLLSGLDRSWKIPRFWHSIDPSQLRQFTYLSHTIPRITHNLTMAYPYGAYDYDDDEDEDQENVDPAVAAAQRAAYEAETLEKAIQESLKVSPLSQTLDHSTTHSLRHFSSLARQIL